MSGAIGLNLIPVSNNVQPSEGSKTAQFNVHWQLTSPFGTNNFNFLQQYQSGQFTTIQSVYIDNSTCPYSISLTCVQTGQTVIVRAFSQGMYPILASTSPSFVATLMSFLDRGSNITFENVTTRFFFLNSPEQPYISDVSNANSQAFSTQITFLVGDAVPSIALEVLPILPPNQFYLINSYSIASTTASTTSSNLIFSLIEMGNTPSGGAPGNTAILRAVIMSPTDDAVSTPTVQLTFPNGLLCTTNTGIGILIIEAVPGVSYSTLLTITFSVVTIE
jgi:hypothetical protein